MTLVQGHRKNRASTHESHEDPALRGRTYAIPFDTVWNTALDLAEGGISRWVVVRYDDGAGVIRAEVRPLLWGENADVLIRIGLDRNAQTRVDAVSSSRGEKSDWGASRRRLDRFFRAMDRRLDPSGRHGLVPPAGATADV